MPSAIRALLIVRIGRHAPAASWRRQCFPSRWRRRFTGTGARNGRRTITAPWIVMKTQPIRRRHNIRNRKCRFRAKPDNRINRLHQERRIDRALAMDTDSSCNRPTPGRLGSIYDVLTDGNGLRIEANNRSRVGAISEDPLGARRGVDRGRRKPIGGTGGCRSARIAADRAQRRLPEKEGSHIHGKQHKWNQHNNADTKLDYVDAGSSFWH